MNKKQRILYATSVGAFTAALLTSLAVLPLLAQSKQTNLINDREIDTLALRAHTRFLSDDLLRGRDTGSEGEHIAAAYIASQLLALGVQPIDRSYLLPVPMRSAQISDASAMVLRNAADSTVVPYGRNGFILNTGGARSFRNFSGDVLYAGAAAAALPLLRTADVRGRIVAFNGSLGAQAATIIPLLISNGASGVFILVADAANYNLYVRSRGESRFFVDANVDDPVWQPDIPVAIVGPAAIRALFRNASDAAAATSLKSVEPLRMSANVNVAYTIRNVDAANVAGIIRGTDPRRAKDVIVYTAHYDHLGVGDPNERGDSIYNGFSDNAAGCAMLLAIAKAIRAHPPAYSVAFIFFTGEERGLLGSSYMAAVPPLPLSSIKGLVNLDAGAPPVPPVSWRLAGGSEVPAIGDIAVRIAASDSSKTVLSAASPNSDYWPFLHRGVPAVFIIPGNEWRSTTAAERDSLMKKWDHYHDPADEYHADFPFGGVARYAAYALALGRAIAR